MKTVPKWPLRPPGKPVEILLVEDNPGDVFLLETIFGSSRYRVRLNVVRDGEEAMGYLYRRVPYRDAPRPELILLDLNLPRKNGHEVLHEIKESDRLNTIPTLVLTSSKQDGDWERAHEARANGFLQKPREWSLYPALLKYLEERWLRGIQEGKGWENPEGEEDIS